MFQIGIFVLGCHVIGQSIPSEAISDSNSSQRSHGFLQIAPLRYIQTLHLLPCFQIDV